jgi:voltage-gated potassium channel
MVTILSYLRSIRILWQDEAFRVAMGLAAGLVTTGTLVYMLLEHWSPLEALYFSVVTLTTVGYGDLSPKTDLGRAFTIIFILVGIGLIVALASRVVDSMVTSRAERLHQAGRGARPSGPDEASSQPAGES